MNILSTTPFMAMNSKDQLLEHMGLLCRTSPKVRRLSVENLTNSSGAGPKDRTCIEAGQNVLVNIRAGQQSGVAMASARRKKNALNARNWLRWSLDEPTKKGESLIFGMPTAEDWALAKDHLGNILENDPRLVELRLRGGVYMTTKNEPETGLSWISFGLHKGQSIRQTLAALGHPGVWQEFSSVMSDLLGRSITERARPWSVAVPTCEEGRARSLIRVGSTNWSRMPETNIKTTRLAHQVNSLGGDRRLAEGIYSLVANQDGTHRSVGVAAEFDFENRTLCSAQYTLRVPE